MGVRCDWPKGGSGSWSLVMYDATFVIFAAKRFALIPTIVRTVLLLTKSKIKASLESETG